MAVRKLNMINIVCKNLIADELLRDLIVDGSCQFVQTMKEIEENDFVIGVTENHADEILDMEDIKLKTSDKEAYVYLDRIRDLTASMDYEPQFIKDKAKGNYTFESVKKEFDSVYKQFSDFISKTAFIEGKLSKLKSLEYINILQNIDVDFKQLMNLEFFTVKFGFLTKVKRKKISQNYENIFAIVLHIGDYNEMELYIIVSPKNLDVEMERILRSTEFMEIEIDPDYLGTSTEMKAKIESETKKYEEKLRALKSLCSGYIADNKETLDRLYSQILMESKLDGVRSKTAATANFTYISAWTPEEHSDDFDRIFSMYKDLLLSYKKSTEVTSRINTPTSLSNKKFFKPFEMLVNMYGVPSYDEMDPTAFLGLTYIILFGAMFGDLGQGMVLFLAGILMLRTKLQTFGGLLWRIGLGSMFFGIIYDSLFGFEHIISKLLPINIYFRPIDNINLMLIATIAFGLLLLLISYAFSIINKINRREYEEAIFGKNGINGMVLFIALLAFVIGLATGNDILPGYILNSVIFLSVGLLIVKQPLTNLITKERPLYKENPSEYYVEGGFNLLETFLAMMSNSISFIRVGAFALNHVGLFIAFRTMANMMGSLLGSVIVIIIGNIIIIGLEGLIVFVQGLRLFYYEMFSKYYKGEGIQFNPDKI